MTIPAPTPRHLAIQTIQVVAAARVVVARPVAGDIPYLRDGSLDSDVLGRR